MNKKQAERRLCQITKILGEFDFDLLWSHYEVSAIHLLSYPDIEVGISSLSSCCGIAEISLEEHSGIIPQLADKNYFLLCLILEAAKCVGISSNKAMLIASINHKQAAWEPAFDFIGFQKIFEGINPGSKNPIKVYMLDLTKAV